MAKPVIQHAVEALLEGIEFEEELSVRGNLVEARFHWNGALYTLILVEEAVVT